jgi:hypothetical protein
VAAQLPCSRGTEPTTEEDRELDAAKEIMAYFLENPEAADSFEGIARWRLMATIVERSLAETEKALRWLVGEGYLLKQEIPGSQSIFSVNREKTAEAKRLVKTREDPEK